MSGDDGLADLNVGTSDNEVNRRMIRYERSTTPHQGGAAAMAPTSDQNIACLPRSPKRAQPQAATPSAGPDAAAAAAAAIATADADEPELTEHGKRRRGRPRVHAETETATEHRRKQIRLAQRAYRNRKETTLTILEAKVKKLKSANKEMSSTLKGLYDSAMRQGVLSQIPDFAKQLQTTTDEFLALSKRSSNDEEDPHSENEPSHSQPDAPGVENTESRRIDPDHTQARVDTVNNISNTAESSHLQPAVDTGYIGSNRAEPNHLRCAVDTGYIEPNRAEPSHLQSAVDVVDIGSRKNARKAHALYGLMITQEPVLQPQGLTATFAPSFFHQPPATQSSDYEIIAQPTLDNASFPVGAGTDPPYRITFETIPWSSALPPPNSMAWQELSFGRRLHRVALERGFQLINSPQPPLKRYTQVFGFCLLFETAEGIKNRLQEVLSHSTDESLHYWKAPFTNLGGSGTFFPRHMKYHDQQQWQRQREHQQVPTPPRSHATEEVNFDSGSPNRSNFYPVQVSGQATGNYGLSAPYRPPHGTGFSTGPFDEVITRVRDERLQGLHIIVPGWQGDFFDSDEVEVYLQKNGVVIPPGADYVKATINTYAFTPKDMNRPNGSVPPPPPLAGVDMGLGSTGLDLPGGHTQQTYTHAPGTIRSSYTCSSFQAEGSSRNLAPTGMKSRQATAGWQPEPGTRYVPTPPAARQSGPADLYIPLGETSAVNASFTFGVDSFTTSPVPPTPKKTVELNVDAFISKLVGRATCLGRSPGFRPADVDASFWAAARTT